MGSSFLSASQGHLAALIDVPDKDALEAAEASPGPGVLTLPERQWIGSLAPFWDNVGRGQWTLAVTSNCLTWLSQSQRPSEVVLGFTQESHDIKLSQGNSQSAGLAS